MSPADSAAALSGVFRITLLTGPSSDLATGRRGLFWLTALRHATTAAPSNSWENRRGIELIGEAAWGANARAPWQLDPWWLGSWPNAQRPHALAYANGSITEGEYAATDVMYKSYAIQSLGPRSFSGTWHQHGLMVVISQDNGTVAYPNRDGTFCAERVTESELSGPRAALRISVTDTAGRRLTNVVVTAVEWPTGTSADSLRWQGDDAPEGGDTLRLETGTYFIRVDGGGTEGGARIVRLSVGQRDSIHFSLSPFPWTPTRASDMVDPRPHLGPPIGTAISDTGAQTPEYTATLDGAAITAGLPLMRRAVLPAGVRQIRLWAGFGNVEPDDMIDLVQRNGEVTGRQLYWFKNPSEYDTLMPGGHDFQFRFAQRIKECGDVRRRDADTTEDGFTHWITCSAAPSRDAKWARLWNQIDSLGVWSLPSDTTLIQYRGIVHTDGVSLVVELREGDRYRTYSYSDPGGQPAPQAAFANRISRLVLEATRFSLRPDPDSAR